MEYPLESTEAREIIDWFKKLPLFLELPTTAGLNVFEVDDDSDQPERVQFADRIRVVHACWDQHWIDYVTTRLGVTAVMDDAFLLEATEKGTEAYEAVERLLKGAEMPLPEGVGFLDGKGNERRNIRFTWWREGRTYRDVALVPPGQEEKVPDLELPGFLRSRLKTMRYPEDAPPVFFGHYWFKGEPQAQRHNVACLDYSAASDGPLVAYMWMDGGSKLGAGRLRGDQFARSDIAESDQPESKAYPEHQLRAAWEAAKDNDQLRSSDRCGCFHCASVFEADELTFEGGWPACPRCGLDLVIGSDSGLPIEWPFLRAVKEFWLEPPFPDESDGS